MGDVRVAVFDREPLFRAGVRGVLAAAGRFTVVAEGGGAAGVAKALEATLGAATPRDAFGRSVPAVFMVERDLAEGMLEALVSAAPRLRTVIVEAGVGGETAMRRAESLGVAGWLPRRIDGHALAAALRQVANGGRAFVSAGDGPLGAGAGSTDRLASLSSREHDVLRGAAQGRTNREIADRLALREKTVKHYMTSILQKIEARNRVEAALIYRGVALTRPEGSTDPEGEGALGARTPRTPGAYGPRQAL